MPRGDDLQRLIRDMATAERRVMGAAARAARESLQASVDAGFAQGQDVDGRAYKPAKDGHRPPMVRSGRLRAAYRYRIGQGAGAWTISISEGTDYGQYLRDGTWKMDPRKHLPKPGDPLPAAWLASMKVAVDAAVIQVAA